MKGTFLIFGIVAILTGCQKYEFVGPKEGQSVFIDKTSGKIIYIDNSNRVVDYVDLKLNADEINRIKYDKDLNDSLNDSAQKMKIWGSRNIPGTKYSLELSTRFYNDKLLYILRIGPYDDGISRFANTVTIDLVDISGFTLETINPNRWTRSVDEQGKAQKLSTRGGIPITLENYFEISAWDPAWRN